MQRRAFLSTAAIATVAGCTGTRSNSKPSERSDGGDADDNSTGPTDEEPEVHSDESSPPEIEAEHRLEIGKWYEGDTFGVRVDSVEVKTSFVKTFGERKVKEMPEGEQLVMVDFVLKNLAPETESTRTADDFAVISGDNLFEYVDSIEGVESCSGNSCYDTTDLDWLEKAEQRDRYGIWEDLESGEKREYWFGAVTPDQIEEEEIIAAHDDNLKDDYEIHWTQ